MFSPDQFREFILPGLMRVREVAKKRNVPFIKHCGGYVWALMDIFVNELQADAFHPSEPAAGMDIAEVKSVYGDRIAVIGNVDCANLMVFGTPKDVNEATRICIERTAAGGGYILSSSNSIHGGIPERNFLAMIEAGRKYGKYGA